jgi:hypothetical protein
MNTDPEVLFHRFFSTLPANKRQHYRGKYNLAKSSLTDFERLLLGLQSALNHALAHEDIGNKHHFGHSPFHVDYVDSDVENAIAFCYENYSFIGITEPLMYKLWILCASLDPVVAKFLPELSASSTPGGLGTVLVRTLLFFVVAHEYTHHVHGHSSRTNVENSIFNEVSSSLDTGNLDSQALEIDADSYAVFLVLNNLFQGDERELSVSILDLHEHVAEVQDNMLYSCFVIAVGAFFYHGTPVLIDDSNIYRLEHPPQAARMNNVMQQANRWCSYNRPLLSEWMTNERFNFLMSVIAEATLGPGGSGNWADQTEFFRSSSGAEYLAQLDQHWKARLASLP